MPATRCLHPVDPGMESNAEALTPPAAPDAPRLPLPPPPRPPARVRTRPSFRVPRPAPRLEVVDMSLLSRLWRPPVLAGIALAGGLSFPVAVVAAPGGAPDRAPTRWASTAGMG